LPEIPPQISKDGRDFLKGWKPVFRSIDCWDVTGPSFCVRIAVLTIPSFLTEERAHGLQFLILYAICRDNH
jgi:hypothetical protein